MGSLAKTCSLFSGAVPVFAVSSDSRVSSKMVFLGVSLRVPVSGTVLGPGVSGETSSPGVHKSAAHFVPPEVINSIEVVPQHMQISVVPVVFGQLGTSQDALQTAPDTTTGSGSLKVRSPMHVSFSFGWLEDLSSA